MNLKIKKPESHGIRLIAVASEKLEFVSEIDILDDGEQKWKVSGYYKYSKFDPFPKSMMYLATGKEVNPESIWNFYPKSEYLYFFIVEEMK